MSQPSPNMAVFGPAGSQSKPPLERKSIMFMQTSNAVGSNTPGAASSAADFWSQTLCLGPTKEHTDFFCGLGHPKYRSRANLAPSVRPKRSVNETNPNPRQIRPCDGVCKLRRRWNRREHTSIYIYVYIKREVGRCVPIAS